MFTPAIRLRLVSLRFNSSFAAGHKANVRSHLSALKLVPARLPPISPTKHYKSRLVSFPLFDEQHGLIDNLALVPR